MIIVACAGIASVILAILVMSVFVTSGFSNENEADFITFRGKIIDVNSSDQCLKYYADYQTADYYDSMTKTGAALKFDKEC